MASIGTLFNFVHEDVSILRTVDYNTMQILLGSFPLHVGLKITIYEQEYEVVQIEITLHRNSSRHDPDENELKMDDTVGQYNTSCLVHINRA